MTKKKPDADRIANIAPFGLRMKPDLRDAVEKAAARNNRSMNSEIIARLTEKSKSPLEEYEKEEAQDMPRAKFPSDQLNQFMVRLPDGVRAEIKAAAEANGRSMNSEIIARITRTSAAMPSTSSMTERYDRMAAAALNGLLSYHGAMRPTQMDFDVIQLAKCATERMIEAVDEIVASKEEIDEPQRLRA